MSLVWTVPVVAAAVAAALVAARARALEEAAADLARAVARLGELRRPLRDLEAARREADARVTAFRRNHSLRPLPDAAAASDGGAGTDAPDGGQDRRPRT